MPAESATEPSRPLLHRVAVALVRVDGRRVAQDRGPSRGGRAVEPVVREARARTGENAGVIGDYGTRTDDPVTDLVIADRALVARRVSAPRAAPGRR